MDPDKYQQAWQADAVGTRVTINADVLLKEVQRHQRNFQAVIFWRDFREVGVALLMLPIWVYLGIKTSSLWTWYLTMPALVWIAGFMLVDRIRHRQKPSEPGEPLIQCVKISLAQVEHQIWLLRNIFWWYLLPPSISIMTFFVHVCWLASSVWWEFLCGVLIFGLVLFVMYAAVYFLNQYAVRVQLQPRRQELLTLLTSLSDETGGSIASDADSYEIVPASVSPFAEERCMTPRSNAVRTAIFMLVVLGVFVLLPVVLLFSLAGRVTDSNDDQPPRSSGPAGDSLARLITDLRKEKNLVGLAAMVMVDGQVEAAAAQGERKIGSGVPLEIGDQWHLGGITKSITATMIARLVESGQMQWSDTIGQSYSEASVHQDWKPVTVRQLLTDTAGAPPNFPREVWRQRPALGAECTQARREAVLNVIADKPAQPHGTTYSNVGVTIAGAMAEKVTGATWEDLVKREVFEPLELTSAGFGPPKSPDETLPQPRGHRTRLAGKVAVDDDADNTPIMGPSGTVHMTLSDLCTYAMEHLRGDLGEGKLLSAETYKLLHTPELNQYACGWIRKEPSEEIPYTVYWHNGSNTMWYALVVFIPEKKKVVAVTSNDGDVESAETAAWEVVKASAMPVESLRSAGYPKKSPFAAVRWQESQPEVQP